METVDLAKETLILDEVIDLARKGPVLLLAPDGGEFLISEADDFEREVQSLRTSQAFQRFLDKRSKARRTITLDEIEKKIDRELGKPTRAV